MKQKIKIGLVALTLIALLALSACSVSALDFPLPITGKVNGPRVGGLFIEVTNQRSGISMVEKTTGSGDFLVEWANSPDNGGYITRYSKGDIFSVKIRDCNEAECSKTIAYTGQPYLYIDFNLYNADVCGECPICVSCPVVEECVQETEWDKIGLTIFITALLSLIGFMGGGLKIYKNRLGESVMQHKHRGVRGYHDPNTSHRNEVYRHRRWKDDPMGCIADCKKINELGGLTDAS